MKKPTTSSPTPIKEEQVTENLTPLIRDIDPTTKALVRSFIETTYSLLLPKPTQTVSEWALENIRFNEPGNSTSFSLAGREFIREPLNLVADDYTTDIVLVFGSQTGKTVMVMCSIAWIVTHEPSTIMWVMPSQELAEAFSTRRWIPMLRSSSTASLLPTDDRKVKKAEQGIGGSVVFFVGSNSPASLSSNPCRVVVLDEADKMNQGTSNESNAIDLAEQRTKRFPNPKKIKTSTPTIDTAPIWQEYIKGDQRRYFMPCPHCGKEIIFAWGKGFTSLKELGCEAYIFWDREAKDPVTGKWNMEKVRKSAHAECPFCHGKIYDYHKTSMLRQGHWKPTATDVSHTFHSYHLSSLYSIDVANNFGNLAVIFLTQSASIYGVHGFVNGYLAEPWQDQEMINRTELVVSLQSNSIKGKWRFLTADYHKNSPHLWYVVRDWDEKGNSVLISFGSCDTFDELSKIQHQFNIHDACVMIDSGYDPTLIYTECLNHGTLTMKGRSKIHIGWKPSKGFSRQKYWKDSKTGHLYNFSIERAALNHDKFILNTVHFNADRCKDALYRMRHQKTEYIWAVTEIADQTYWHQMDGEIKRERLVGGQPIYLWERKHPEAANHLLDCEVLQLVFAMLVGILNGTVEDEIAKQNNPNNSQHIATPILPTSSEQTRKPPIT